MPTVRKYRAETEERPERVRFHEIRYLMQPGSLVYASEKGRNAFTHDDQVMPFMLNRQQDSKTDAGRQKIWRLYRVQEGSTDALLGCSCDSCVTAITSLDIICYHLDFDGDDIGPVSRTFRIKAFDGGRDIISLPVYPLRYAHQSESVLAAAKATGEKFAKQIQPEGRHAYYRGWSFITNTLGEPITDGDLSVPMPKPIAPVHIENHIMIDFEEGFNQHPAWKPIFVTPTRPTIQFTLEDTESDPIKVSLWKDADKKELISAWSDQVVLDDGSTTYERIKMVDTDRHLSKLVNDYSRENNPKKDTDDADMALLPKRVVAYSVWERRFFNVDVDLVQPITRSKGPNPFDLLEIEQSHKDTIEAIIQNHFAKKAAEQYYPISSQDLIKGKGKGVIILLHGVPGVGKTATAEAIAEKFGQPLFPITCGDLGTSADQVERTMTEIFRLAHHWDCVLLLDEAEIFITQRDQLDLERNALVSSE